MKRSHRASESAVPGRPWWRRGGLIVLVGIAVIGLAALVLNDPSSRRPDLHEEAEPLIGRWMRGDGDYVLEIKSVQADGSLDAAYFNPQPIHVAAARVARSGGRLVVTVELQDEDYPGSNYRLTYDAAGDRLAGIYTQLPAKQEYEVNFERMPPQ